MPRGGGAAFVPGTQKKKKKKRRRRETEDIYLFAFLCSFWETDRGNAYSTRQGLGRPRLYAQLCHWPGKLYYLPLCEIRILALISLVKVLELYW